MSDSETGLYRKLLKILGIVNWLIIFFSASLVVLKPEQTVDILFFEVMHKEVFVLSVLFFGMILLPLVIHEYRFENLFEEDFEKIRKND